LDAVHRSGIPWFVPIRNLPRRAPTSTEGGIRTLGINTAAASTVATRLIRGDPARIRLAIRYVAMLRTTILEMAILNVNGGVTMRDDAPFAIIFGL
jgi:hypothetical protein